MPDRNQRRPPRRAAALRYDPAESGAPTVVAAGRGEVADRIIREAESAGVPVRAEPTLAEALIRLGVGAEIPPALYTAVAELLAWVAEVDQERSRRWP